MQLALHFHTFNEGLLNVKNSWRYRVGRRMVEGLAEKLVSLTTNRRLFLAIATLTRITHLLAAMPHNNGCVFVAAAACK